MAMLSKFPGTCRRCGAAIEVGMPIGWARRGVNTGRGGAWHINCNDHWNKGNQSEGQAQGQAQGQTFAEQISTHSAVKASDTVAVADGHGKLTLDLAAIVSASVQAEVAKAMESFQGNTASVTTLTLQTVDTSGLTTSVDLGVQHKDFATLLSFCNARDAKGYRLNFWLAGAAGTGKTTAASMVAKALGLPFYYTGSIDTQYALSGFIDAHGRVVSTEFRKAYSEGGVFLFDEVDGSSPNATLAFNAALANSHAVFPDGQIERHKDFLCIAAANTWGLGATNEYVGRNKLDAAFLDRFVALDWNIDEGLETATCGNPSWSYRVQQVRSKVKTAGIKVLVTPRASYYGAALLAAGIPQADVERATLHKGMTESQWNMVK